MRTDFDKLPKRGRNHQIQKQSESAFESTFSDSIYFDIQSSERRDYGTDYVLEAISLDEATNVRVHVQLKGTEGEFSAHGAINVPIKRTTLNYLAMPPGSILVCHHVDSGSLLVVRVDDVIREYEHSGKTWQDQASVTIKFKDKFDKKFQEDLNKYAIASAKGARDSRLRFATASPPNSPLTLGEEILDVPIPAHPEKAAEILEELHRTGKDKSISKAFEKFYAVLASSPEKLLPAYMAEINLGMNNFDCNKERIHEGVQRLNVELERGIISQESLLYCIGNGWLALKDYENARDAYNSALFNLDHAQYPEMAAQCYKNLGSAMEHMGHSDAACALFNRALGMDPRLPEAHFALALSYIRRNVELDSALEHLDSIVWSAESAGSNLSVQGWRAEVLFKLGRTSEAIRDIHSLLAEVDREEWVWPWCARLISTYGKTSIQAAEHAVEFWDRWLENFDEDIVVSRERLLCIWFIRMNGGSVGYEFVDFKLSVEGLVARGAANPAFLWDRAGHWAQEDGNWAEAEVCYRSAYDLSPKEYGYCLGTALNFLERYDEALPILREQAEQHLPDAMSWFQVAVASEGVGDAENCILAYEKALSLNDSYANAWFNLGGVYWNTGNLEMARSTWTEAIRRFPEHKSIEVVRRFLE